MQFMRYIALLIFLLFLTSLLILGILNPQLISIDIYFYKLNGISLGYSMIGAILFGSIISFILQLPILLRKPKSKEEKDSGT